MGRHPARGDLGNRRASDLRLGQGRSDLRPGHARLLNLSRAEHLVPPHGHTHDEHEQGERRQPDGHIHQHQRAGDRTSDQQANRDGHDGDDRTEPDHLRPPLTPKRSQPRIVLSTVVLTRI